jgi:hypothetical protein
MSKSVKVTMLVAVTLMLAYAGMMFSGCSKSSSSTPAAPALPTYSGTVFMASEMGGHIGVYKIKVDPNNTASPITVVTAAKKELDPAHANGTTISHIFHDVRYDAGRNRVYYSTIIPDGALLTPAQGQNLNTAHLGYVNMNATLDAGVTVPVDSTIDVEAAGAASIMNLKFPGGAVPNSIPVVGLPVIYCASAQATVAGTDYFIALSMTMPAYIDSVKKSDIESAGTVTFSQRKRFHVEDFRGSYAASGISLFAHGMNSSPDGSKLYVAVNEITAGGYPAGAVTGYLLKMTDVVAGTVTPASIVKQNTISGLAGNDHDAPTVAFRSSFTPDGGMILQSGKDRFLVLDGTTLAAKNGATGDTTIGDPASGNTKIENHDAMPTPDGKYAILTIRYTDSTTGDTQTSGLQLYDLTEMKPVGKVVSTCSNCHAATGTLTAANHLTCGIDGKLTKD